MSAFAETLRKRAPAGVVSAIRGVRALGRRISCDVVDLREGLAGRIRPLTPPRRMWELVGGRNADFHAVGQTLADVLIRHRLKPSHRVLDIGSGIGRLAVPLTSYLQPAGGYDGVDIMPKAVAWCQQAITPKFPNFRFHVPDVKSDRYNPRGRMLAQDYVFPFPDASFDFVFLGSVFTHMFDADMRNYLSEIARVMKPGATSVISYYLLDEGRRASIAAGPHAFSFAHALDGCWCEYPELPEIAIAFERADIEAAHARLGLELASVELGSWASSMGQDQDLVIARRTGSAKA